MVPTLFVQPVSYELLVVARLRLPGRIPFDVPEPAGVWSQSFVDQRQRAVYYAEFHLRVGQYNVALPGVIKGPLKDGNARLFKLASHVGADHI